MCHVKIPVPRGVPRIKCRVPRAFSLPVLKRKPVDVTPAKIFTFVSRKKLSAIAEKLLPPRSPLTVQLKPKNAALKKNRSYTTFSNVHVNAYTTPPPIKSRLEVSPLKEYCSLGTNVDAWSGKRGCFVHPFCKTLSYPGVPESWAHDDRFFTRHVAHYSIKG